MAEFRVAAVFSSNMVLQREKNVKIFGEGADGQFVRVSFRDQQAEARVQDGRWCAVLAPMRAGGGDVMTVSCKEREIVFSNVAVGEVWLAGGQSNMEFELQNCTGGKEALAGDKNPGVRFYYTQKNAYMDEHFYEAERRSGWSEFNSESAKCWSAVGYFFARRIAAELGVTVGIIGCNWGGTSASAWVDRETLCRDRELRSYVEDYEAATAGKTEEEQIREYREYEEYDAEWNRRAAVCYAENPSISWEEVQSRCGANRWPGPMGCINPFRPAGLYECMLKRVMPYTLCGFLYYQGESDDHKPLLYDRLLSELIMKWRRDWEDYSLPFLMVQLPMHRYEADPDFRHWCLIREAQMKVFQTVKNTGLAVILDCGEFNEIHPKDKLPVGERLALQAMWLVYRTRSESEVFGPVFRSAVPRGDSVELHFDHAAGGVEIRGGGSGFEVAGEDGIFYPAAVRIAENGNLLVAAGEVPKPRCVRYCWTNYGPVNYFGKNGLPMAPFRTGSEKAADAGAAAQGSAPRQVMEL